jgi:hypothetical protein
MEFRNSTYPKDYFPVLMYEVNFSFPLSRIGKVTYLALGYSSCSCSTLRFSTLEAMHKYMEEKAMNQKKKCANESSEEEYVKEKE